MIQFGHIKIGGYILIMEMTNTQTLYGLYGSHISRTKAVGYCKKYKAYLTVATLKNHKCLGKKLQLSEKT